MFSEKAKKIEKSSQPIWHYVVSVKTMVKILSSFVAFSENLNFYEKLVLPFPDN